MAERWQQWMPFHIDRFRGSPDVQAMHPVGRIAYLYLLASAWQTDDCSVPSDPIDLATLSGIGDELWVIHGPRILRKFSEIEGGRLRNDVVYEEWLEAKRIFEQNRMSPEDLHEIRSAAGKAGAAKRWQKDSKLPKTHSKRMANAANHDGSGMANDGLTGTGTETTTGTKAKTSSSPPGGGKVKVPDPRHTEFRDAFRVYFLHKNPGLTQEPWDEQEAANLARFLKKNPQFTTEQWKSLLQHRARSPVAHADALSAWIGRALNWLAGPKDGFGKQIQGVRGSKGNGRPTEQELIAHRQGILDARAAGRMADGDDHAGGHAEAGVAGDERIRDQPAAGLVLTHP